MTGWNISVYRQKDGGNAPATDQSIGGARLAVWQTGYAGLDWIRKLVEAGQVISLGGDGYPYRYTAPTERLLPRILDGPPNADRAWIYDVGDIIGDAWEGQTVIDREEAGRCSKDEWLLISVGPKLKPRSCVPF